MEIFEDQIGILIGHKEILEGKGIPNEVVFAELQKKLDIMKFTKTLYISSDFAMQKETL
jgi:hypothetical protein